MERQAGKGRPLLGEPRQLTTTGPVAPPATSRPDRLVLPTLLFAAVYVTTVPAVFFLVMVVFTWELFRWLLFSVMLVPALLGLGLLGLIKGLIPSGLLIGAIAVRTPNLHWPKLLAAATVPVIDLLLLRASPLPRLLERGTLLLMDHRALFALDTIAPLTASVLVTLAFPQRLVRRLRSGGGTPPG